ncbi:MAG: DEAD/DEAH box helicase [Bdellovibrionaceae bacterium]|nr:DEAD/DEAH box helicase [Pseudobdellovibrionaceae bacterium]
MQNPETFSDFQLLEPLLLAVKEVGYDTPTPIQKAAIPSLLAGHDLLGCAQTGTGKTAAFALPILQNLTKSGRKREPRQARALILTPTRELAIQIYESFTGYGKNLRLKYAVVYGGVGQTPQVQSVAQGVDVLVATPGRLLDLIQQKYLRLEQLEIFVLDEADRMLDMGFIHDIRRVIQMLPNKRHNLFFSATLPKEIEALASTMLVEPVRVEVTPVSSTVELIQQSIMFVDKNHKKDLLRHVLKDPALSRVIVFTRTKHGANKVVEVLTKNNITSAAIHGNKSQTARQHALENFRKGRLRVLVATDIAARGIDIDGITHVINFEIPNISESYVHRIGRTARAGASGKALSFCDAEEKAFLKDIEKLIGKAVPVDLDHTYHSQEVANSRTLSKGKAKAQIEAREDDRGGNFGRRRNMQGGRKPANGGGGQSGERSPGGRDGKPNWSKKRRRPFKAKSAPAPRP